MKGHYFRKLEVWQRTQSLIVAIYSLTSSFPAVEQFGITSQLRRAVISISLNIAEGSGSGREPEFIRFLFMAKRSGYEVVAALEIASRLGYSNNSEIQPLIKETDEICSMLVGMIRKLQQNLSISNLESPISL